MARRLAIVGGDAAGMSAASTAKRRDPDLEVVAFERGPYTSYSACGIPYYLGGLFDDSDRLISRSPDEHRANGIDVHARTEVTGIDLAARTLAVRDHQTGEERTRGLRRARARHRRRGGPRRRSPAPTRPSRCARSTPPSASARRSGAAASTATSS